jgi:DNA-damage-inducible protein D
MTYLTRQPENPFDQIRHQDENGKEFWYATELLTLLDYQSWRRQKETVERAIGACENSGQESESHFTTVVQMAQIGDSQAFREVIRDYKLSRYACYLTAMNGDPRKPAIAEAQTYFAMKTREAEVGYSQLEILEDDDEQAQALIHLVHACRRIKAVDERLEGVESEQNRYQHSSGMKYSVLAFAQINDIELSRTQAANLGRRASQECKRLGIAKDSTYDPRYGTVGIYPVSVLQSVFGFQ